MCAACAFGSTNKVSKKKVFTKNKKAKQPIGISNKSDLVFNLNKYNNLSFKGVLGFVLENPAEEKKVQVTKKRNNINFAVGMIVVKSISPELCEVCIVLKFWSLWKGEQY